MDILAIGVGAQYKKDGSVAPPPMPGAMAIAPADYTGVQRRRAVREEAGQRGRVRPRGRLLRVQRRQRDSSRTTSTRWSATSSRPSWASARSSRCSASRALRPREAATCGSSIDAQVGYVISQYAARLARRLSVRQHRRQQEQLRVHGPAAPEVDAAIGRGGPAGSRLAAGRPRLPMVPASVRSASASAVLGRKTRPRVRPGAGSAKRRVCRAGVARLDPHRQLRQQRDPRAGRHHLHQGGQAGGAKLGLLGAARCCRPPAPARAGSDPRRAPAPRAPASADSGSGPRPRTSGCPRGAHSTKGSSPIGTRSKPPSGASSASSAASSRPSRRATVSSARAILVPEDHQLAVGPAQGGRDPGQQIGGDGGDHPDAQRPGERDPPAAAPAATRSSAASEQAAGPGQQRLARGGGQHPPAIPIEQLHAQRPLGLRHLRAQRGLRDAAGGGRPPEAAAVGHRHQVLQLAQGDRVGREGGRGGSRAC